MVWEKLLAICGDIHDNRDNLRRLVEQVQLPNGIVPFVGAGMSIPFGYPGWQSFLEEQARKAGVEKQISRLLKKGQFEEAARDVLAARGNRAFHDSIQATFAQVKLEYKDVQSAVSSLPAIATGPVITTNFDHVLERVFEQAGSSFDRIIWGAKIDSATEALIGNRRFLIKLHGDADESTDRILTLADYQKFYGKRPSTPSLSLPIPRLLQQVVLGRALLFLGASLNCDRTVSVLARIARNYRAVAHYAIVEQAEPFFERARYLSELSIRPIWFPKGEYQVVQQLLQELATLKQSLAAPHSPALSAAGSANSSGQKVETSLNALAKESPIFKGAIAEIAEKNSFFDSTLELLLTAPLRDSSLDSFWMLAVEEFANARFGLAIGVVKSIDRRNVGHSALEFCLEGNRLEPWQRDNLGMHMQYATSEVALRYFHSKLVNSIRSDTYYNSFLNSHLDFILANCYSDMAAYLLFPDRGPGSFNVDSFYSVVSRAADSGPLLLRWQDWINRGLFDHEDINGSEPAEILYKIFNGIIAKRIERCYPLIEHAIHRIYSKLKQRSQKDRLCGFYHLASVSEAKFLWADRVGEHLDRVYLDGFSAEERKLFNLHKKALTLIARKHSEAVELDLGGDAEVEDMLLKIYEADNISGFWQEH